MTAPRRRLGLIINPIAGMGGRVGLKGTDTPEIIARARALGAEPQAPKRALEALRVLAAAGGEAIDVLAAPGAMGEASATEAGLKAEVVGATPSGETTSEDTVRCARAMAERSVDLILFAGGDGTARDMVRAVGDRVAVIGIPAGVKMHSAVYATTPRAAAAIALRHLAGGVSLREREVMDIDEAAFRAGAVSAKLYGYLRVPHVPELVQSVKAGGVSSDRAALAGIAASVVEAMTPGRLYILGPGTTTRAIAEALGAEKTLLGVDLLRDGKSVAADVTEADILAALDDRGAAIVVTPIGGQGHIFGRGNQQISAAVIERVGLDNIVVVATMEKLASIADNVLRVDTGDAALDKALCGWRRVVTGYDTETVCRVAA